MPKGNRRRFHKKGGTKKDKSQDRAIAKLKSLVMPELKNFYVSLAPVAMTTALKFISLDSITVLTGGVTPNDAYSRIGNKIHARYLQVNIFVRNTNAANNSQFRCAIVRLKDASLSGGNTAYINPSGALGHWNTASFIQGGRIAGPGAKDNSVKVLWDSRPRKCDPAAPGVGTYTTNSTYMFHPRIPLNHISSYETTTTQAPDNNALYYMSWCTSTELNESFESKLSYLDS